MVKRANAPSPPDHSVLFRFATTVAVLTGIMACESVGELSISLAVPAMVLVVAGMTFSYATRRRPWQWLKILLALAVVAVFGDFVSEILRAAHTGELSSIELPLAALFTWVQVIHAYDVPARRDLLFSLAAAGALLTIAGAQAVSGGFLVYTAVWLLATMIGLACSWRSMAGGRGPVPFALLALCLVGVLAVALSLLVVLPQPKATENLTLPASLTSHLPLGGTGIVNGSGPDANEPAQAGKPGGSIGVGGYIGFAGPLSTAVRGSLGDEVIMRVRADRPGYFLGETYDTWNGQSWLQSAQDRQTTTLAGGSPFDLPPTPTADGSHITSNVQTFYVTQPLPNLLFGTANAAVVYFPTPTLILGSDGSIRSTVPITPGTVYTVVSADDEVSQATLASDPVALPEIQALPAEAKRALQLPHPYPRVEALALRIVAEAHATTIDEKVRALEAWMGEHTEYTTDIPPLAHGQDTVTQFLFHTRRGYCEQISTSLAVMLRTLGIPAREAIGYVPGPFDPLSDLYEIQAKDAHAWVQVYFPHFGWQSFDPTAEVPLAAPNAGSVIFHDLVSELASLPWAPIGGIAGAGVIGYGAIVWERRRRRRPATWGGVMALRLERLGARAGLQRKSAETLAEYAARLEVAMPGLGLVDAGRILERDAYGPGGVEGERAGAGAGRETVERALSLFEREVSFLSGVTSFFGFSRAHEAPRRSSSHA